MLSPGSCIVAITFSLLTTLSLSGCTSSNEYFTATYTPDKTYQITFLYSDSPTYCHSALQKSELRSARYELTQTIRSEIEEQGGYVLNLSSGDLYPLLKNPDSIDPYDTSYDAMAIGSYLFDLSVERIKQQQQVSPFPFLSANIYEAETGKPLFDAYDTFDFDGLNISVVGITSQELFEQQRKNISTIEVSNPVRSLTHMISVIRPHSDMTVVLSQNGYSDVSRERITEANIRGLDLILGGQGVEAPLSATAPQTCSGRITQVNVEFRNGEITDKEQKITPVNIQTSYLPSMRLIDA